jgi:proline dehydrogenase
MIHRMIAYFLPFLPERFVWLFSKKYIAGKDLASAVACIDELKTENIIPTIDVLGESVNSREEADQYLDNYLQAINAVQINRKESSFSLKPTMFGLHWDPEFCYESVHKIVALAASKKSFVRIDMEDSSCTDPELKLFRKLYLEFPAHVGIVLQSYLKRTLDDIDYLNTFSDPEHPVNIRLCKGIYIEPKKIAFRKKQEVRDNFIRSLRRMLEHGFYPALATHDKKLVRPCLELIREFSLTPDQYEFQMLLGVTPRLRKELLKEGHRMRVYVPYGENWFKYATRRLQENPNMVWDILAGIVIPK